MTSRTDGGVDLDRQIIGKRDVVIRARFSGRQFVTDDQENMADDQENGPDEYLFFKISEIDE